MNKKCMFKVGAIRVTTLLSVILLLLLIILTSANSESVYSLGDNIRIDLSNSSESSIKIKSPSGTIVQKSSEPYLIYKPEEIGDYVIQINSKGNSQKIRFSVTGKELKENKNNNLEKLTKTFPSQIDSQDSQNKEDLIEIGRPVVKSESFASKEYNEELTLKIPSLAENVSVFVNEEEFQDFNIKNSLVASLKRIIDKESQKDLVLRGANGSINITYTLPGPESKEKKLSKTRKEVKVFAPDNYGYKNVRAYTNLDNKVKLEDKNLIKVYWKEEGKYLSFNAYDEDNDGFIDIVEWFVPHLSEQTFEISIEVLNTQSYPIVGGIWKVDFKTTGRADLRISGFNGTIFGKDLNLLEIKCGDEKLGYKWEGSNTVMIKDYECDQIGSETSRVLTHGKHTLEFDFGGEKDYAYNAAGAFVNSVENLAISLSTAQTSNTATLSLGQNISNVVPFVTKEIDVNGGTADNWDAINLDFFLSGTNTVNAQRQATDAKSLTSSIYAVEFNPDQVRVQNGTFTIAASSASTTASLTTVNLSKAALVFYFRSGSTTANEEDENAVRGYFSATNQLTFERAVSNSAGSLTGTWYVFEDLEDNFEVQNTTFTIATSATSGTGSINSINTSRTFTIGSYEVPTMSDPDGGGYGSIRLDLQDDTTIRAIRSAGDVQIDITAFAITFLNGGTVQRGLWSWTGDTLAQQSTLINQVNLSSSMAWTPVREPHSHSYTGLASSDHANSVLRITLPNSTAVQADRLPDGSADPTESSWEVIEWPTIIPDTASPLVTINLPENKTYGSLDFPLNFNVILSENGSAVLYSLDGGATNISMSTMDNLNWNHTNSSIPDGTYTFRVYANDTSGNRNDTEQITFSVDTSGIQVLVVYPQNTTYTSQVTQLNYSTAGSVDTCWYSLDEGASNTTITCGTNVSSISSTEGSNTWTVYANDSGGNITSDSVTFFVDTIGPSIDINSPISGSTIADVTPTLNVTLGETAEFLWYTTNGGTTNTTICTNCNGTITKYLHLSESSHTVTVYANDSSGNLESNSTSFTIDMNFNYFDNFSDNSSISEYNNASWFIGNVSLQGTTGPSSESWNAFEQTGDSVWANSGRTGDSFREIILASSLNTSGDRIRVKFQAGTDGGNFAVNNPTICQRAGSTSDCVYGTWKNLTIQGSQNYVISNGAEEWSDWLDYPVDEANDYMVTFYLGATNNNLPYLDTPSAMHYWASNVDVSLVENWSGIPPASENLIYAIEDVEVQNITGGNFTIFSANLSSNIIEFSNITWDDYGIDAMNNLTVQVSPNNGQNWYEATKGQGILGIALGDTLLYRVIGSFNETNTSLNFSNINISWTNTAPPPPNITINSPTGTLADVTPTLNITTDSSAYSIWYNIDGGTNITLCASGCSAGEYTKYIYVEELAYTLNVYANNSLGAEASNSTTFTIDMNFNYFDNLSDNSSLIPSSMNYVNWSIGNISFQQGYYGLAFLETFADAADWTLTGGSWAVNGANELQQSGNVNGTTAIYDNLNLVAGKNYNISMDAYDDDNDATGIIFRYIDSNNFYRCTFNNDPAVEGTGGRIVRIQGGVETTLDTTGTSYTENTFGTYGLEIIDGNILCYINDQLVLSTSDATWENGRVGIYNGFHLNARYDNYTVYQTASLGNYTVYSVNTSSTIVEISNVSWTESGTDTNNNITIEISADHGQNWYEATKNQGITGIAIGTGLAYRAIFKTNNTQSNLSLLDMNITWSNTASPPPNITINSPVTGSTITDVSPTLNLTLSSTATALFYNIDGGTNTTICNDCSGTQTTYLYLEEGSYTVNVYASNILDEQASNSTSLTIETNLNHFETYDDDSPLQGGESNNVQWYPGNVTFQQSPYSLSLYDEFTDTTDWTFNGGTWSINGANQLLQSSNNQFNFGYYDLINMSSGNNYNITVDSYNDDNDPNGILFRFIDTSNFYRCTFNNDGAVETTGGRIIRMQGGGETVLNSTASSFTENTWSNYRVNVINGTIYCYIDDQLVMTATDTTWEYGQIGIYNGYHQNALYDNFTIEDNTGIATGNFTAFEVNVTETISDILNVSWTESGTDTNNNLTVEISADNGGSWSKATNNQGISSFAAGSSLIYRILFSANESVLLAINDINITWTDIAPPVPNITINSPTTGSTLADVTPTLNVTLDATANTLWYTTNGGTTNTTICGNCLGDQVVFLPLEEGPYTVYVYANNSIGGQNSNSTSFTVDMARNYYDNFDDNSSLLNQVLNGVTWQVGNISFNNSPISPIEFQRAGGSTGTSHTIDIGSQGNNRLIAVFLDDESTPGQSFQGTISIGGITATQAAVSDNPVGAGNHQEMHIFTESDLGSTSGSQTISYSGGDAGWAIHVQVFYNVKDTSVYDVQIDNTSVTQNEILPSALDIPENGLVIFGAANGQSGTYNNADWDTNPTEGTDDGLTPEIEMTESTDGPNPPSSAVLATAYWISNTTSQTNRIFRARGSVANNRGTGIIASFQPLESEVGNFTAYNINVTNAIKKIVNITWNESGITGNNSIDVNISVDGGLTWYNTTNGQGVLGFSTGSSLVYRVFFNSNGSTIVSLSDMNISWSSPPTVEIVYPQNTTYTSSITELNYTVVPGPGVTLDSCWYSLDEGASNTTITCGTNVSSISSTEGSNTWTVYANDSEGAVGLDIITFTIDSTAPNITFINQTDEDELLVNDTHPLEEGQTLRIRVNVSDLNLDKVWIVVWDTVKGGTEKVRLFFTYMAGLGLWVADIATDKTWDLLNYNYTIYANDTADLTSEYDGNFSILHLNSSINLNPNPSSGIGNVTIQGAVNYSNGTGLANHPINLWQDNSFLWFNNLTTSGSYNFNQDKTDDSDSEFNKGTFYQTASSGGNITLTSGNYSGNYSNIFDAGALVDWDVFTWNYTGSACSAVASWQENVEGFSGTSDSYVDGSSANTNFGTSQTLFVDTSPTQRTLILLDLIGPGGRKIPYNSTIYSANLSLNINDAGDTVSVYEILEQWAESQVTYNNRLTGTAWSSAGVANPPSRSSTLESSFSPSSVGSYSFSILNAFSRWTSQTSPNYGVVLSPGGSNTVGVASSENSTGTFGPTLTVNFSSSDCTSIVMYVRTSNDKQTWSSWQEISNGESVSDSNQKFRYVEYRAELGSINSTYTPLLESVSANYTAIVTDSSGNYAYNLTSPSTFGTYDFLINTSLRTMFTNATSTLDVQSGVSPTVELISPPTNQWFSTGSLNLTYNVSDPNNDLVNTTLIINGAINQTNSSTVNNYQYNNFSINFGSGQYNWTVNATDADNNVATDTQRTFYIDLENPVVNLIYPPNATNYSAGSLNLSFNTTDNMDSILECDIVLDGSTIHSGVSVNNATDVNYSTGSISAGTHYWNVSCTDESTRSYTSPTWEFTITDLPPVVYLFSPEDNNLSGTGNIPFAFNVSESIGILNCSLIVNETYDYLNQSDISGDVNILNYINLTSLSEGDYNWTVGCFDTGLNYFENSSLRDFSVDLFSPQISLNLPADLGTSLSSNVNFNFTVTDTFDSSLACNLTIDSSVVDSFSATNDTLTNRLISGLTDGPKNWNVTCIDDAGHTNTSSTRLVNVTEAPTVYLNTSNGTFFSGSLVTLDYTPNDNTNLSTCSVYINGAFNQSNQSEVINHVQNQFEISGLLDGSYDWYVNCSDYIGLSAASNPGQFYVDNVDPLVNLIYPDGIDVFATNITFNFTATDAVDPSLTCNLTVDTTIEDANFEALNATITSREIAGVTDGFHIWYVNCTDGSGNSNGSQVFNFTRVTAPLVQLVDPSDGQWLNFSPFNLTYYVEDDEGFQISYLLLDSVINRTNSTQISGSSNNTFEINDFGDGVYNWTVIATDTSGQNGTDAYRIFYLDRSPPQITLDGPADLELITVNNVSLNYTVVDNLDSILSCQLYLDDSPENSAEVSNNTQRVEYQLIPDGNHTWYIDCYDEAGNLNTSQTRNFTVEAPPFVTLDSPPADNRTTSSSIVFIYTPYDDIGITSCSIYLDGAFNDSSPSIAANQQNNFSIGGITEGTHNWTVACTDPDSNTYTPTAIEFTIDLTGPNITLNAPINDSGLDANTANVLFNWTSFDDDTLLTCDLIVDSIVIVNDVLTTSGFAHTESESVAIGEHYWNVTCWDTLGNINTSETRFFNYTYPDFEVNSSSITFNNTEPREGEFIEINASIQNLAGADSSSVTVSFYNGNPLTSGVLIGSDTITIQRYSSNLSSVIWNASLGTSQIYVAVDPPIPTNGTYQEWNESNNLAFKNISVGGWHFFYGDFTQNSEFILADNVTYKFNAWGKENLTSANVYVADYDSSIDWTALQSIGKTPSGTNSTNDVQEIDSILNMGSFNDSVTNLYWNGSYFKETRNYPIFGYTLTQVPITNSINSSSFKTGILWDTSDDTDNEFNSTDSEDLVFITHSNESTLGSYGITDYEIRVPAKLREYKPATQESVAFYVEIL